MAELFEKYSCTNCQDEITGVTIHCSVCSYKVGVECENFSLCLHCFAAGAEIGPHKNDHSYYFTDTSVATSLSGKNVWTAREKLRLLEAIEVYNFGNWEDISKYIETRSAKESKKEYLNKYLNGAIGRHTWLPAIEHRPKLDDHTVEDKGESIQSTFQRQPPLDVTPKEAVELQYMPNRNDFDREYDPSAEELVSTLSICSDDDDADIAIKLAQVDIYVRRLRERTRRKRIARDYQLICNFFRGNVRRQQFKDQREFRDRFRVFAQFFTAMEFDRRIGSFEREKALRGRLSDLYRYRWNGLQRLEDGVHFEQHAASIHKNNRPFGLYFRTDNRVNVERQPLSLLCHHINGGENQRITSSNLTGQKFTHHIGDPVNKKSLDNYQLMFPIVQPRQQQPKLPAVNNNINNNNEGPPQQEPGVQLLSSNEIQLCSKLNLPATRYITLKTVLLSGAPCNSIAETHIKHFLIRSGWLHRNNVNYV